MKLTLRKYLFHVINWISRHFFASRLSYAHIEAFLFTNSYKKFVNLINVHWDMWRGNSITSSIPYIFVFEVTNVCNLKCPFCLTGKGISGGREVRHMKLEEAKIILDSVGNYIYFLQVYTWGEPLLNKDLIKIIEYAKQKNIYVMLSTNATAMTPDYNSRLLDSGIDYITVAIDGGSNATYQKYRVGGNYDKVINNVTDMIDQRKKRDQGRPFLEWQYIVFRHNEHETQQTENIAYEMGINKFTPLPAYVEDEAWSPRTGEYRTEVGNPERLKNCDRPWSHLNVRADGGVASCCYTFFKKDDFGELSKNSFCEIWNNSKFQQSRRLVHQAKTKQKLEESQLACYECMKTGIRPSFIEIATTLPDQQKPVAEQEETETVTS